MELPADRLLQALLDSGFDLAAIRPLFSAREIADLALDERFRERLGSLIRLSDSLITLRAAMARTKSMSGLDAALAQAQTPIEKRRTATALLRASAAPLIPRPRPRPTADPFSKPPDPPGHPPSGPPAHPHLPIALTGRTGHATPLAHAAGRADTSRSPANLPTESLPGTTATGRLLIDAMFASAGPGVLQCLPTSVGSAPPAPSARPGGGSGFSSR